MPVDLIIKAQGKDQVDALNNAIQQYSRNVKLLVQGTDELTAKFSLTSRKAADLAQEMGKLAPAANQATQALDKHGVTLNTVLEGYLKYRVVSGIFNEVTRAVGETIKVMADYERQTARVTRISGGQDRDMVSSQLRLGASTYGVTPEVAGETMYQLRTYIDDQSTLIKTYNDTLKLLVGTEGDARETTRTLIQLYYQFGGQLGATTPQAEKFHKIIESIATSFRDAHAEVGELSQALKYFGPIANSIGIPFSQVMGLTTAMTGVGQRGRMMGTAYAQLMSNIYKNYDEEQGGLVYKGNVYKFDRPTIHGGPDDGRPDAVATVLGIIANGERIRREQGYAASYSYLRAIGGSSQAARALGGTEGGEMSGNIIKEVERMKEAANGQIDTLKQLHSEMDATIGQQAQRVWQGFFASTSRGLDQLIGRGTVFYGLMKSIADFFQHQQQTNIVNNEIQSQYANSRPGMQNRLDRTLLDRTRTLMQQSGYDSINPMDIVLGRRRFAGLSTDEARRVANLFPNATDITVPDISGKIIDLNIAYGSLASVDADRAARQGLAEGRLFSVTRTREGTTSIPHALPGDLKVKSAETLEKERKRREAEEAKARREHRDFASKELQSVEREIRELGDKGDATAFGRLFSLDSRWQQLVRVISGLGYDESPHLGMISRSTTPANEAYNKIYKRDYGELPYQQALTSYDILQDQAQITGRPYTADIFATAQALDTAEINRAKARGVEGRAEVDRIRRFGRVSQLRNKMVGGVLDFLSSSQTGWDTFFGNIENINNERYRNIGIGVQSGLFASQMMVGLPGIGTDSYIEQIRELERNAGVQQSGMTALMGMKGTIPAKEYASDLLQFQQALEQIGYTAKKLYADRSMQLFAQGLEDISFKYEIQRGYMNLQSPRRRNESPQQYQRRVRQQEGRIADTYVSEYSELLDYYTQSGMLQFGTDDQKREALMNLDRAALSAAQALNKVTSSANDEAIRRRDEARAQYSSALTGGILDLYHGRTTPGKFLENIGNMIVDNILVAMIKPFVDPLVNALADQTNAVKDNTDAINGKGTRRSGTDEVIGGMDFSGGNDPLSIGLGASRRGRSGSSGYTRGGTGIMDFARYGLAAYSIYQTGAQAGPIQGALGGALSGFGLAGPIGAAVGGVVGLFGGLFGHHSDPMQTNKNMNPSFYNAPSDFNYYAYRYRATGQLPQIPNFNPNLGGTGAAPIVNVYIDGTKTAVKTELASQTSLAVQSKTNAFLDMHSPR